MTGEKIIYNKVVHDVLNKLIEFKPSKDTLKEATNNSLRVVFNLKDKEIKRVDSEHKSKEGLLEEKSKDNIDNEVKNPQHEREGDNSTPPPDQQVEKNDQSLKFVLETYINEHTDLETRIAYLKRFASPELLRNLEEELRQREHDKYVYMIQAAEEIEKEEYLLHSDEMHRGNHVTDNDEDDSKSNDLLNNIFKGFNHEEDDLVQHILKHSAEPQHIIPLIYLVKEFKNVIENSGNPQDKFGIMDSKDKTNNRHQNKFVHLLCDKYINSNPIEQENLLKVLNHLHLKLESKKNEIPNERKITQEIRKPNLSR